jgi:hypothetical protein
LVALGLVVDEVDVEATARVDREDVAGVAGKDATTVSSQALISYKQIAQ